MAILSLGHMTAVTTTKLPFITIITVVMVMVTAGLVVQL